jgi:hypothetical protein
MLEKLLSQQLDRLGSGWKSITGLGAYLLISIAVQTGLISPEMGNGLRDVAVLLFGLGIVHKVAK